MTSSEVIQRGHEILCHLEELSSKIETELNDLMVASSDNMTRHALRAGDQTCKLDLLEVYCEEESNLTTALNSMDVKAKRFTRQDCLGGFCFCLFALDCLTLNGFLFSVVSIASAVSGTTSTFIFDVSFCSFFW